MSHGHADDPLGRLSDSEDDNAKLKREQDKIRAEKEDIKVTKMHF